MNITKKQNKISTQEFQPTTILFQERMTIDQMDAAGTAAVEALAQRGISARYAGGTRTQTTTGIDLLPVEAKR